MNTEFNVRSQWKPSTHNTGVASVNQYLRLVAEEKIERKEKG